MTRPLRIEYPGAYYHVSTRGNERKAIFRDDRDRERLLELIARAVKDFHLRLHGYVLMSNHLLVETPRGGLNRALRYLNGVYTQAFNRRHHRVGHLFQGGDTRRSCCAAAIFLSKSLLMPLRRYYAPARSNAVGRPPSPRRRFFLR